MIREVRHEEIPTCVEIIKKSFIHFCYKKTENVNSIISQYCQSIDIGELESNYWSMTLLKQRKQVVRL